MKPIDWDKPIELMDGMPAKVRFLDERVLVGWKHFQISVDYSGRIGGVQVVRNRKEPVKHVRYVRWNEPDRVMESYPAPQAPIGELNKLAKIILWRDETGKTKVEVVDG